MSDRDDSLSEIRAGLRANIDGLARSLLGEPVRGGWNARTLKFGSRSGSLHVQIRGPKQGLWFDHAEGVGGDGLALIQRANGGTFTDTVVWAANWLGINLGEDAPKPDPTWVAAREAERQYKTAEAAAQEVKNEAGRVKVARRLWSLRRPLAGTAGAQYLASRKITEPAEGWPDCLAFLPATHVTFEDRNVEGQVFKRTVPCAGAVIVAATDVNGLVQGVQRMFVDAEGFNIRDSHGRKIKITNGVLRGNGAVVRLPRRVR